MAGCVKALGEPPKLQVDSLMLLEAAFSHFGFSADNGRGVPGFFRDVIVKQGGQRSFRLDVLGGGQQWSGAHMPSCRGWRATTPEE